SSGKSCSSFCRIKSGAIPLANSSWVRRRRPLGRPAPRAWTQSSTKRSSSTYPRPWHHSTTAAATAWGKPRRTRRCSSSAADRARTPNRRRAAALAAAVASSVPGRRGSRIAGHRGLPVVGSRRRLGPQGRQARRLPHLGLDLRGHLGIFLEELLGVFPALAQAHIAPCYPTPPSA